MKLHKDGYEYWAVHHAATVSRIENIARSDRSYQERWELIDKLISSEKR